MGPWAAHLKLGLDWGMGRYSKYHCRSYMQKSAQVNYLRDRHYLNSSRGYYWFQPCSSTVTNRGQPAFIRPILHRTVDSNRNSNGWFMRTALQIIEVRSKNNPPNSRRTKPSLFYAVFEPQKNDLAWLAILTMPT